MAAEGHKLLLGAAFISLAAAAAGEGSVSLAWAGAGHTRLPPAQPGGPLSQIPGPMGAAGALPPGTEGLQPPEGVSIWGDATSRPRCLDVSQGA